MLLINVINPFLRSSLHSQLGNFSSFYVRHSTLGPVMICCKSDNPIFSSCLILVDSLKVIGLCGKKSVIIGVLILDRQCSDLDNLQELYSGKDQTNTLKIDYFSRYMRCYTRTNL